MKLSPEKLETLKEIWSTTKKLKLHQQLSSTDLKSNRNMSQIALDDLNDRASDPNQSIAESNLNHEIRDIRNLLDMILVLVSGSENVRDLLKNNN